MDDRTIVIMRARLLFVAVVLGCGNPKASVDAPTIDSKKPDAHVFMDATNIDAGPRGPAAFPLAGGGNGVLWDNTAHALYLTDDTHDALVKWTDANSFQMFGTFPAGSAGIALGSIVQLTDGSFLVPSFGFGTQGTLFTMAADGSTSGSITGLDATRRRIGFAQDSTGLLYEAYFTGGGTMMQTGGVASVAIATGAGTETAITSSIALKKVVGLVATTTALFVCDQTAAKIYSVPLPTGTAKTLASLPSCDQLTLLPSGDIASGSLTGGVYRITSAGVVSTIASGFDQVRGTAYDPTMKRLFIVEHSSLPGGKDTLHVIPLDQ
jgi:hypothetical protein